MAREEIIKNFTGIIERVLEENNHVSQGLVNDSQGFSQEPCETHENARKHTETHECDCISRQAVQNLTAKLLSEYLHNEDRKKIENMDAEIGELPPVSPEIPKGKWIDHSDEGYIECPFCHSATNCDGNIEELHYCFSCGANMKSEDNE